MFKREVMMKAVVAAVIAASLTGCGGGSPAGVDEEWEDTGYTDPAAGGGYGTTPTGTGQYGGATGGYGGTTGAGCATTPAYGGGMAMGGDLTASVIKKKNGTLFGMGKFTATIEVSNPSSSPKSGTLTATFKNGSKSSKTAPHTETVNLGPNETRTIDVVDKAWSTDAIDVEITTDAAAAGGAGGYGTATAGCGTTGAYGSTTGAYGTTPTTGYGTTPAGGYGAPTTGYGTGY